jgi:hypothetical protein
MQPFSQPAFWRCQTPDLAERLDAWRQARTDAVADQPSDQP